MDREAPTNVSASARTVRLDYLDGLRGVAALYVVLFHATIGFVAPFPEALRPLGRLFSFGHEAVGIFIVLSGYCLTLSATRFGAVHPRPSLGPFLFRRARRLLPPYYAAMALSLAAIALIPALGPHRLDGTIWADTFPALAWGPIVSHLLLVHNWFPVWVHSINGPHWSVATEWQIYPFLPLVLVPLRNKFGAVWMLFVAFALGYCPLWFAPEWSRTVVSWYLPVFAAGVFAALIHFADGAEARLRELPWGRCAVLIGFGLVVFAQGFASVWFRLQPLTDLLVGVATAIFLVWTRQAALRGRPHLLGRWLELPIVDGLGRISYSLYLTHLPVLALLYASLRPLRLSWAWTAATMLFVGTAISVLFAWVFYALVERHFLNAPKSSAASRSLREGPGRSTTA